MIPEGYWVNIETMVDDLVSAVKSGDDARADALRESILSVFLNINQRLGGHTKAMENIERFFTELPQHDGGVFYWPTPKAVLTFDVRYIGTRADIPQAAPAQSSPDLSQ